MKSVMNHLAKRTALAGIRLFGSKKFMHRLLLYAKNQPDQQSMLDDDELRFLGYLLANARKSNSQIFQDLWVMFETAEKERGFFVEFGATDGILISNSYVLEKTLGWNGVLSEPAPVWHERLSHNRSCQISKKCVWTKSGETMVFRQAKGDAGYSTLQSFSDVDLHSRERSNADQIDVETISLNDLLIEHDAPKYIDYLSIDTEGSELPILEAFDFDRFHVHLLSVEHNYTDNEAKLNKLLLAKGFERRFPQFSMFDGWYRNTRLQ